MVETQVLLVNIRHDVNLGFVAEFSTDFHGDLNAVKNAGFRTTGPPQWFWYTAKLPVLNKLRENKPASGLTIAESAYQAYLALTEIERVNEAARAQFAPIKEKQIKEKKERKKRELKDQVYTAFVVPPKPGEEYDYVGVQDLPPMPPFILKNPPQPHSGPFCTYCRAPVYFYEKQYPIPVCLFCEISEKSLDKQTVLC